MKKRIKISLILCAVALLGAITAISLKKDIPYGIALEQDNFKAVIVNDKAAAPTNKFQFAIPEDFKKIAENDTLELYLEEESIAIAVKDKSNGYTWFSYDISLDTDGSQYTEEVLRYIKSGITVKTYDKFTPARRTVLDDSVKKTYDMKDNGFTVTVDFLKPKIRLDLNVELNGGDLLVYIPKDSIEEYNPKLWKAGNDDVSLNEISIYPFLGSTKMEEDGYMVLPDGSGALVNLKEKPKYAAGYSAPVYGKDQGFENTIEPGFRSISVKPLEKVSLPIYGIVLDAEAAGLLVIAESGASYATYNYVSRDLMTQYYQSYFTYSYRTAYSQFQSRINEEQHILGFQEKPNQFDLVQRYVFLNNEAADYVGVAKGYRDFLVKKDGFKNNRDSTFDKVPMKIDIINNEMEVGTFGKTNVPATSYDQTKDLVNSLIESGYDDLSVTLKTYSIEDETFRFKVLRNLGGRKDFAALVDVLNKARVKLGVYSDYMRAYDQTDYTASKMSRQTLNVLDNSRFIYVFLNNPKYLEGFAKKDVRLLQKKGITNIGIDGYSGSLFTHYDEGTIDYSNESMAYIKKQLEIFKENNIQTSLYRPDAYLYAYMKDYYDTPVVSSELAFIDATIPLVSLVVSGYVDMYSPYMNFSSNETNAMLRLIEYGVYPSFILTGESTYTIKYSWASSDVYVSDLESMEGRMKYSYDNVSAALNGVVGREMINHEIITPGVVVVTYDNNARIVINNTSSDFTYEGVKINAKGYVIL